MSNRSIAVLPFATREGNGGDAWFGQGIADEVIHTLSWVHGLRVAPLSSSMRFQPDGADLQPIATRLDVETLLVGDFQRSGEQLDLNARLVNASDGATLWGEHYSGSGLDILDFLDDILGNVVVTLELQVLDNSRLTVKSAGTRNAAAYDYYLQGLNFFFRYAAKNLRSALQMFEQAVRTDSGFARAWARLAECHAKYFMYYDSVSREHRERATAASKRAVELAPDFARAHTARGLAHLINKELMEAEDAFERAVSLNPRQFDAYYQHARACFQQGNLKKAAALFEKAAMFQPEDYQTPLLLRQVYLSLGRVDEAKATAQRGLVLAQRHLELNPKDARAIYLACGSMIQLGMYQQAMNWSEKALALDPDDPMINYNVACCYAQAGEPEKALDCLEKGKGSGMLEAGWLKNDSDLFSLHDHPRFQALLAELRAAT